MKTSHLIICSIFAALTAVCSYISIPLPFTPVPINLALLPIFLAGALTGSRNGLIAAAVYVLLGAVGLPVFHGGTGGLAIIAGPTGGYILGYLLCAYFSGKFKPVIGMVLGLIACYAVGTAWFMVLTGTAIIAALTMCVIPFLFGDALKILLATFLSSRLKGKVQNFL